MMPSGLKHGHLLDFSVKCLQADRDIQMRKRGADLLGALEG
jgi:hypothetical protein